MLLVFVSDDLSEQADLLSNFLQISLIGEYILCGSFLRFDAIGQCNDFSLLDGNSCLQLCLQSEQPMVICLQVVVSINKGADIVLQGSDFGE